MALRYFKIFQKINLVIRPINKRSIMSSSFSFNKAMHDLQSNPFFDKYSSKIAALQFTSPEEFLSRLETSTKISEKKSENTSGVKIEENKCSTAASSKPKSIPSQYKSKRLDDVMKTELLQDKNADEISKIWEDFYKYKDGLAAVIPDTTYLSMKETSEKFPLFLFALPRSNGYEFIVCQWQGNDAHFTSLINYQAYHENAPECLTLHHFCELIDSKKIALMRGEFDSNMLNQNEATCLVNQLQLYYNRPSEHRLQLLKCFTETPEKFKHMDVIADMECLSL